MTITDRLSRPNVSAPILGVVGVALALVIVFAGNYNVPKGENGGTGPGIVTGIICLVLALALFGYVVPRAKDVDRVALILSVIAVLSVVVFWSGVTPVLTSAAIALTGRKDAPPARPVVIAEALALLATLVALVVTLAQSHLF